MIIDPNGKERSRLEGYLTKEEFRAHLEMGLARVSFARKDWADAERRYTAVEADHPGSSYAPQAAYYRGVSRYSTSHESSELAATANLLAEKYSGTEWQVRSLPWQSE